MTDRNDRDAGERRAAEPASRPAHFPDWLGPDTPLTFANAARFAFPDGSVSAAALKGMADRGLLTTEAVGRSRKTTLNYIQEMRERCRRPANPHASSSVAAQVVRPSTSSSTTDLKSAQAAALIASERRRKRSRAT
ncbi:hypothetical protein [Brevundimonas sp.]|uniref:hypothetical protein n=1 Tax=Brevundimonas sp. TaxID=1871086 RepID=UPI0025C6BC81|nr:hypothetical protein [Brevundimonas sp.]